MDIVDLFIKKNTQTDNINSQTIKDLFQSENNINYLSNKLYREKYLSNNQNLYIEVKNKVKQYIKSWISLGKLDNLEESSNKLSNSQEILIYYNRLFIDTFKNIIVDYNLIDNEIKNNPYNHKVIINNKLKSISELQADEYQYISFNNYNDKFNLNTHFKKDYNKIPYYEKGLYKKHYDRQDKGSLRNRSLQNTNSKLYNNNELFNNIDYLK